MESESSWKYWLFNGGLLLSLGILLVGVIRLSIIKQKYYSMLARENRVNEMVIPAARGKIVDRKGRIVAKSVYQYFKKEGEETGKFTAKNYDELASSVASGITSKRNLDTLNNAQVGATLNFAD